MAKRSKGGRTQGGSSRSTRSKAPSTRKSAASSAGVEVVEEEAGEGIDTGILVMTSILLLAAILFADYARGQYGDGMFF